MSTETNPSNSNFGPDWLRNKPVFSKFRYGQEELLGLWTCSVPCPETITSQVDLSSTQPLKPVSLTNYTDEEKDSYQNRSMMSDRGRGRGRGGGQRGTRRSYDYNNRYFDHGRRNADTDNWRRRDPEPDTDHTTTDKQPAIQPITSPSNELGGKTPPYYPPFPSTKPSSPPSNVIKVNNKENNSWKRAESGPTIEDSPESMLRSISKTLQVESGSCPSQPPFNTTSIFSTFADDTGTTGSSLFSMASSLSPSMANNSDMSRGPPSASIPGPGMNNAPPMTQSVPATPVMQFNNVHGGPISELSNVSRSPVSHQGSAPIGPVLQQGSAPIGPRLSNAPGNISSQVPPPSCVSSTVGMAVSQSLSTFPSLSEIGKSLQAVQDCKHQLNRGQGFVPPQPPAPYSADELWFYLDPKGNTQGPFDSVKMYGWFNEGYFGMDLEIRRTTEDRFIKLETMITQHGRIPFQPDDKNTIKTPPPQQTSNMPISTLSTPWTPTTTPTTSIWGGEQPISDPFHNMSSTFMDESAKSKRAEEIRKEIENALAMEQQRKQQELEEERRRKDEADKEAIILEQQRILQAKLQKEQQQKEAEMLRFREEEIRKKRLFEEEVERIKQEKERLETERMIQAERVRAELEEAERARQALAQERLKLERERELVKQKEESLKRKEENERKRLEQEARAVEDQRRAAQQAAAEAKAQAQAQEEARKRELAAESAKRAAEKDAAAKRAAAEAAARAEPPVSAWRSPPCNSNNNPWANLPSQAPQMTQSTTRTPAPSTRGWGKTAAPTLPLSSIQHAEQQNRGAKPKIKTAEPKQPGMWATPAHKKQPTKSLADIQREEEGLMRQEQNLQYARQNDWNPVAGMLDEDIPKPKSQSKKGGIKPTKQATKQASKQASKKNTKNAPPLLDMFSNTHPKDDFTLWCESQVNMFKNQHIDVPTFISFLRDVESPMEVREYVISYLGDNKSTDEFIKEFCSRRKHTKHNIESLNTGYSANNKKETKSCQPQQQPPSRKGKKKKMQKVNAAALLGINCTASSDARNRGDIDSVVIN